MKKIIILLIIALFLLSGCTDTTINNTTSDVKNEATDIVAEKYSREEVISDIDFLVKTIEEVHPNLYAYKDKEKFYNELSNIKAKIDKPMSSIEIYKVIAPLISSLKDGHTNVYIPNDLFGKYLSFSGEKIFPLIIEIRDNRIFNLKALDKDINIPAGAEILSINDVKTDEIIEKLKIYETGMRDQYKEVKIERDFYFLLWMEYQFSDKYKITYSDNNDKVATVDVEGVLPNMVDAYLENKFKHNVNYKYKILDDNICYLDFNSFTDYEAFNGLLDNMFKEIKEKNIENLIIDIRDNGGGNSRLGDLLISYIYDKPFFQFKRVDQKISKQIIDRDNLNDESEIGDVVTYNSSPYYKSDVENRFNGRICVLTNRYTFSSAADFASTIKDFSIGVLLGEETGGLASSYGDVYSFNLPNSNLRCGVSFKYFVRPSGDEAAHGIIPNHDAKQNLKDVSSEKDSALEFVKEYILHEYDKDYKLLQSNAIVSFDYCELTGGDGKQFENIVKKMYKDLFKNDYDSISQIFDEELKAMFTKDMIAKSNSDILSKYGNLNKISISKVNGLKKDDKFCEYYVEGTIICDKGNMYFNVTFNEMKKIVSIYTH